MEAYKNVDRLSMDNEDITPLERFDMGAIHCGWRITSRNRCYRAEHNGRGHKRQYNAVVVPYMLRNKPLFGCRYCCGWWPNHLEYDGYL